MTCTGWHHLVGKPRVIETPDDGPALAMSPDAAGWCLASIRMVQALRPNDVRRDEALVDLTRCLRDLADRSTAPRTGSDSGTSTEGPVVEWVSTTEVSRRYQMSPRAITKRIALGKFPGARKVAGAWMIPAHTLPDPEDTP